MRDRQAALIVESEAVGAGQAAGELDEHAAFLGEAATMRLEIDAVRGVLEA